MAALPPNPNASMGRTPPPSPPPSNQHAGQGCSRAAFFTLGLLLFIGSAPIVYTQSFNNATANMLALVGLMLAFVGLPFWSTVTDNIFSFLDRLLDSLWQAFKQVVSNNKKVAGLVLAALIVLIIIFVGLTTSLAPWQVRMPLCDLAPVAQLPTCGDGIGTTQMTVTLPIDPNISINTSVGIVDGSQNSTIFSDKVSSVEQRIFTANQNISRPFITLIVATTLSDVPGDNNSLSVGNEDLQGVSLFQETYNGQHQESGKQVRVLIANLGSVSTLDQTSSYVTRQIVLFAQHDATFAGVVGFPFSGSAANAMKILAGYDVPVVSPSASSIALSSQAFFHRIAPPDDKQAQAAANYIANQLSQNVIAVFIDSDQSDSYSNSLGNSLIAEMQAQGKTAYTEAYTANDGNSIEAALKQTLKQHPRPTLVFFAGLSKDFDALHADINAFAPDVKAMGGDALYELGGYTDNYRSFYFTAFVYPDTIAVFCQNDTSCLPQQQQFLQNFRNAFDPGDKNGSNYGTYDIGRPGPHAILSYDATDALERAANSPGASISDRTESKEGVNTTLAALTFQGVSGFITFSNGSSNPAEKAVLVLCVDSHQHTQLAAIYGNFTPNQSKNPMLENNTCAS